MHEVRKRCKEVRALARLVRLPLGEEFERFNATVRDAADVLAPIRDAQAVLATLDDLRAVRPRSAAALERVRGIQADAAEQATRDIHSGDARIEQAREMLVDAREHVERWRAPRRIRGDRARPPAQLSTWAPGAARGDRATDRRARARVAQVGQEPLVPDAAARASGPEHARRDDRFAGHLGEALGDDHDLAVLVERLAADPHRYGGALHALKAIEIARAEQAVLREPAFRLGATIYAEKPKAFVARIESYWTATVREGPELATGGITELASAEKKRAKARRKQEKRAVALVPPAASNDGGSNADHESPTRAQLAN